MLLGGASAVPSTPSVQVPPSPCQHSAVTLADEEDESHRDFVLFLFCFFILVVVVCMISHRPLGFLLSFLSHIGLLS